MKRLLPALLSLISLQTSGADVQDDMCDGPLKGQIHVEDELAHLFWDKGSFTHSELDQILIEHVNWYASYTPEREKYWLQREGRANLCGVSFQSANLIERNFAYANLSFSNIAVADFSSSYFLRANFSHAYTNGGAKFVGANLNFADLTKARFPNVDFTSANLSDADFSNAILTKSNFTGARLIGTNLDKAQLSEVNLTNAVFEPDLGDDAIVDYLSSAIGLSTLKYNNPRALVSLRRAFKEAGFREQEKAVTFAIKHIENLMLRRDESSWIRRVEGYANYVLFELTTRWGMAPSRALTLLILFIPGFAVLYMLALWSPNEDGIWKKWAESRTRRDLGSDEPELLKIRSYTVIFWALYFSTLSAFHVGWREFNVGTWITRVQPREYNLAATGWVRMVSGIQSLVSVFLLAIWVLTYFGRPFE